MYFRKESLGGTHVTKKSFCNKIATSFEMTVHNNA
jgi:hypothetical protein